MDVLLTTGQLASAIGVSVSTACRLANQGMPHSLTPGGKKRWSLDDARAWLEDRMIECEHEAEDDEDLDDEEDLDEGSSDETEVDEEDDDGYDPHDVESEDEDEDPEEDLDDEEGDDEPCPTCGATAEDEEDDDGEDE